MTDLVFYEKPGCVGNQQQKAWLRAHGVVLEVRDLLSAAWTTQDLRRYFGETPVERWFNDSAPDVKTGVVDIRSCSAEQALQWMLQQPLLIRRPLMQLGDVRQAGFVAGPVLDALGVALEPETDMQSCPMDAPASTCEEPA